MGKVDPFRLANWNFSKQRTNKNRFSIRYTNFIGCFSGLTDTEEVTQ
jgi:hypothetical protein